MKLLHNQNMFLRLVCFLFIFPILVFADEKEDVYKHLNLFGEAFEKIKNNYVEEVEVKDLIESAIEGMLNSLDPHSTFLNTDELNELKYKLKENLAAWVLKLL